MNLQADHQNIAGGSILSVTFTILIHMETHIFHQPGFEKCPSTPQSHSPNLIPLALIADILYIFLILDIIIC